MIVEGQVHGGVAQGIGQALLESCVYDKESGQLLTGSYMDYAMPRADDLPSFKVATKVTPCTPQSARRQGLRRGRRDRRAGGADERGARCAASAVGVKYHRHAGDAASRVAARCNRRSLLAEETPPCTHSNTNARRSVADAAAALAKTGGKALAGGQSLVGAMKLRPRATRAPSSTCRGIAELEGHQEGRRRDGHRRDDAPHAEVAVVGRRQAGDSGAGRARRRHRRSPGAQHGHDRRLARQQRSGGRLAGRGARPRCDGADQQAQDRRRRFLQGHVRDGARRRRDHHRGQLPGAEESGVREVPAIRRRASRWSACSSRKPAGGVRVAVTGAAAHVHRAPSRSRMRSRRASTADAAKAVKIPAAHLNNDLPEFGRIPRAPRVGIGGQGSHCDRRQMMAEARKRSGSCFCGRFNSSSPASRQRWASVTASRAVTGRPVR